MSLLTREERKLPAENRKKLRKERRAAQAQDPNFWSTKLRNSARKVVTSLGGSFDLGKINSVIDLAISEIDDLQSGEIEEVISEVSDLVGDQLDKVFDFSKAKIRIGPAQFPVGAILEKIDGDLFDAIAYLVASSLVRVRVEEKRSTP